MERDFNAYKTTTTPSTPRPGATKRRRSTHASPGEKRPSTMATYGRGILSPSGHRALIEPAAQASRLAYT
jgi:hypothetical protein